MYAVTLMEELNSFIAEGYPPHPSTDLVFKLKHLGWHEWQFVAYDEETGHVLFFDTYEALERFHKLKARMILEDLERSRYLTPEQVWKRLGEFENRLEILERKISEIDNADVSAGL